MPPSLSHAAEAPPELQEHLGRLEQIVSSRLASFATARRVRGGAEAAAALEPLRVRSEVTRLLDEIEAWYRRRHREEVVRASGSGWAAPADDPARPSWLVETVREPLDALVAGLVDLQTIAQEVSRFETGHLEHRPPAESLARAALILLRLWDLPKVARGWVATLREAARLERALDLRLQALERVWQRLAESVEEAVVEQWNRRTVPLLEQLERTAGTPLALTPRDRSSRSS